MSGDTIFDRQFQDLLLDLLHINTVTPMETQTTSPLSEANARFCQQAVEQGFSVLEEVTGVMSDSLPLSVQTSHQLMGEDFFTCQPSVVLGVGNWQCRQRTLMFNFHMDTVGPLLPAILHDGVIYGRGAIDNKGPGVAVLAAVKRWLQQRHPDDDTGVLIQLVGGEEGGAMGTYGTRLLCDQGYYGALNLFVIPSEGKYYDCSTSSMTAEITVTGQGATDDSPWAADNATVILASVVNSLVMKLAPLCEQARVKMTIAGLHTGDMHNRVYGSGRLLINFACRSTGDGETIEQWFAEAFEQAKQDFVNTFAPLSLFYHSSRNIDYTLHYRWLKKGLPVLNNRHAGFESLLAQAGIERHQSDERTFTCDAMWGQRSDAYTIMYGPGSLEHNGAHTDQEAISLAELESFSQEILGLLTRFAATPVFESASSHHSSLSGETIPS